MAGHGEPTVHVYDMDALYGVIGHAMVERVAAAVAARGKFTVAVSGGSLPKVLAGAIEKAETDRPGSMHLSLWNVVFADERNVPLEDEESNYAGFIAAVGKERADMMTIHPISPDPDDVEGVAASYEKTLKDVVGPDGILDMVLLGMGPDGHTASLFPGHVLLDEKTKLVASISDSPKPPPQRVTLTYRALHAARHVFFIVTGEAKRDALSSILIKKESHLPASRVHPATKDVHFFLDTSAGKDLN